MPPTTESSSAATPAMPPNTCQRSTVALSNVPRSGGDPSPCTAMSIRLAIRKYAESASSSERPAEDRQADHRVHGQAAEHEHQVQVRQVEEPANSRAARHHAVDRQRHTSTSRTPHRVVNVLVDCRNQSAFKIRHEIPPRRHLLNGTIWIQTLEQLTPML